MTTLMSTNDLANHEFPIPPYLVDPIIPQGGTCLIHGKPNVGKSHFMLTLAACFCTGTPLFDRWGVRQGPVVIFQADMPGQIQKARVMHATTKVDLTDVHYVIEEDGSIPFIDVTKLPIQRPSLMHEIRAIDPVAVFYDTVRKVHRLDENISETPVAVYQKMHEICPTATNFGLGHDRKESRDPNANDPPGESIMGNIQWWGAADTTIQLSPTGAAKSPKRIIAEITKCRTAPEKFKAPFALSLNPDTLLLEPA